MVTTPANLGRRGLPEWKTIDEFSLSDLEAVRLILRGGSVIDWYRLNFTTDGEINAFLRSLEVDVDDPIDMHRADSVRDSAVGYLRRNFQFPVPKPVEQASIFELLTLASGAGHRQMCACTILKVMHIIYHLEARELLFRLPVSDQQVFKLVEEKILRIIGAMLHGGFPILEFIGGRKNRDSIYTKLLSKKETIAAQIYDKLRFRLVTRGRDGIFPTLNYLTREVFPFNYVIPGESTNTVFHFRKYCEENPHLARLVPKLQLPAHLEEHENYIDNSFTAKDYRVVHFVVDLPVRLPEEIMSRDSALAREFGKVIFVQTEFQVIDRDTEQSNEMGDASHAAYKERQKLAVIRRLKMGAETPPSPRRRSAPPPAPAPRPSLRPGPSRAPKAPGRGKKR